MKLKKEHRVALIRFGKMLCFAAAILVATKLTLAFGTLTNASTAAFIFLVIVLLSAFFGDLSVAVTTSVVATLCFDYFYLPPFGTFNITAFSDWISLAAFLLASVIISHLAAAAAENRSDAGALTKTLAQLTEFGEWLLSMPQDQITLTEIATKALDLFSLEYCSIHVYGEGKWRHFTGTASTDISRQIENRMQAFQDHPSGVMELADEDMLGVQFMKIATGTTALALLAVKSRALSTDAIGAIAYMIGTHIRVIV
jgi:two-component system, OmpR family, sensor histidine kinase KdpD